MALDYLPSPSWAVIYGETPSADRWSELGENDDALATGAGIDDLAIIKRHIAASVVDGDKIDWSVATGRVWREELGRQTLSSGAATMTVSFTAKKYLQIILAGSGSSTGLFQLRFNNDSGTNYARRTSTDGAVDATAVTGGVLVNHTAPAAGSPAMAIVDVLNIAALQKLAISRFISDVTTGSGTAPSRNETATKWVNTVSQINRVDALLSTGSFNSGSELIILGHD